jgi:hypothetical protein
LHVSGTSVVHKLRRIELLLLLLHDWFLWVSEWECEIECVCVCSCCESCECECEWLLSCWAVDRWAVLRSGWRLKVVWILAGTNKA